MTTTDSRTERATIPGRGDRLPGFSGHTPSGETIRLRDFYLRRNLALVFTHDLDCASCGDLLERLGRRRATVQAEAGEVLAVTPDRPEQPDAFPFPIVLDEDGGIHRRYGLLDRQGHPLAGIFLADRYGVIFESVVAAETHALPDVDEIVSWLEFIACRCS